MELATIAAAAETTGIAESRIRELITAKYLSSRFVQTWQVIDVEELEAVSRLIAEQDSAYFLRCPQGGFQPMGEGDLSP
jgi:hypothetical protein